MFSRRERKAVAKRAFLDSLPVLMGYSALGLAAGVLLSLKGGLPFAPLWSLFIAVACVSGTMSIAIVPALAAQDSVLAVAALTLGINFRYAFYGFALIGRWKACPMPAKAFMVWTLADEIFALDVACRYKDGEKYTSYCFWNHLFCTLYWTGGSVAGSIAGSSLPIPSKGVEFAMAALFIVIFTDQLKSLAEKKHG